VQKKKHFFAVSGLVRDKPKHAETLGVWLVLIRLYAKVRIGLRHRSYFLPKYENFNFTVA
jgi:hypothetical protein